MLAYCMLLYHGAMPARGQTAPRPVNATISASDQALAALPVGVHIPCEPWRPGGRSVAGYVWRASHTRAVILIQPGYGHYALRYVSGNNRLIPQLLVQGISVYAFDMRGNGYSPGRRGVVDVEQAIQDNLAARQALRDQPLPVFLFGHSLGGLVAVSSALRDPQDLAGLLLLAPANKYDTPAPLRWIAFTGAALFPSAAVPGSQADVGELVADASVARTLRADKVFYPGPLRFLTAAGGLRQSRRNWPAYHALRTPLLAVHGTADTSTDPAGSRALIALVASSDKTLLSVPGGRHALLDDTDRDCTLEAILSWIDARTRAFGAPCAPMTRSVPSSPPMTFASSFGLLCPGLHCVAALCAMASAPLAAAALAEAQVAWPIQRLSAADASTARPHQFVTTGQAQAWQDDLDRRGLRATGSPAHEAYVDALYARLKSAGVQDLHYESVTLERWTTETWSLAAVEGNRLPPLPAASYLPYSGITPAEGITAPVVRLRWGARPSSHLAGKIVMVEVPSSGPLTKGMIKLVAQHSYDPHRQMRLRARYQRPFMYLEKVSQLQEGLEKVGAAGMIVVTDRPNAYRPYDRIIRHLPGLYVGTADAEPLKALVVQRGHVRLILPAEVGRAQTRNLLGVVTGASPELIALNSHTDGTNGIEDNGPNAIVDIAQYLTRLPRAALPRGVLIILSSGHMAAGVRIEGLLRQHANDGWLDRIGTVVTIEHMGAREWLPDAEGLLVPTGQDELGIFFMPKIPALLDAKKKWLAAPDAAPGAVLAPLTPRARHCNRSRVAGRGTVLLGPGQDPHRQLHHLALLPSRLGSHRHHGR
ncbi:Monoacylglycerol lipase [Xanthomonas arboricola pv. juglandis]|uniref:alpha/beta fold hydrolase n=1 Tax=Xanthomonas TaxID=338 RepID=UPI000E98CA63|nr:MULTISPECIES: alpha/beta fold hydrolase [Xanthomonas]SYZ51416.1 Monoacylglycerol lipase [Xanthomonas arboricola pv. juglandis]